MNKKELATVAVLILLIPTWLWIDRMFVKPMFPEPPPAATPAATPVETPESDPAGQPEEEVPGPENGGGNATPESSETVTPTPTPDSEEQTEWTPSQPVEVDVDEERGVLETRGEDGELSLTAEFSNLGASLRRVVLHRYPVDLESKQQPAENPIVLDFGEQAALTLEGAGFPAGAGHRMESSEGGRKLVFTRPVSEDLVFRRTLTLEDEYVLRVVDQWENTDGEEINVPDLDLFMGPMRPIEGISQKFGPYVGVDAAHTEGVGLKRYWKKIRDGVNANAVYEETFGMGVEWFSVKNKFFTQVLTLQPGEGPGAEALTVRGKRGEGEALIGGARPSVRLEGTLLSPGDRLRREYTYYVGPVSMERLKALGGDQQKVIDFRLWSFFVPIATLMMNGLNALHGFTGNWGVAIILLTFVVRMLFWPLTQKGTENMKRMSELSPQMKEIREKYKSNPQKLNQEMAAFYKKHKVNPMAGCLPMFVQIPVFISLYGVLRVAVELRFAEFLWIQDLSEQEALFMVGDFAVNILPLTMGATMVLQQRLTPSNMDPQQQKIMMMMPIVFLFITYTMPAGLLLYWTTSNLVSIYQTTHTRRKDAKRKTDSKASPETTAAPAKKKTAKKRSGKS